MNGPEINIFSVEDDPEVNMVVSELMDHHGITNYRFFTRGSEMLQHLTADIHICLLDHYLDGGLTGLDVLRKVKEISADSFVIIVTGQTNIKVVIQYLNECADRYVDKNDDDYLEQLAKHLTTGLVEAKKRYQELQLIADRLKKRNDRLKKFDL